MSKQFSGEECKTVEIFEKGTTFHQLSPDARETYHQLDLSSKHIFIKYLEQDLRRLEAEDWRGKRGKQEERDRILKKVSPDLKSLLGEQRASEYWQRRLLEGKSPEEARQNISAND